jgi:DNA invertase Pin-like site-specific DNA recombinase
MNGHDRTGFPAVARDGTGAVAPRPTAAMHGPRSAEITDRHFDKLAIVYVRQSSPQQVFDHKESRERQYAMADQAVALGWPRDRVLVIDEDQGRSGRTAGPRLGFQNLLAEVTMDHVGLVLGLELCRLSRSSRDWYHLVEVCGVFGTLLADQDRLYDPTTSTTVSSWA